MYLYLVQHAEALNKEEDPSRSLSDKGIEDIKNVASKARNLKIEVRQIVHSGKMRAMQTAQVLADHITVNMEILESDGLLPKDDPVIWRERISKLDNDIMLVGHLPHLAKLASLLIFGNPEHNAIDFEMSCIVCMYRSDDGIWTVVRMIKTGMTA
jgi:phosphohistidine phosphatase